MSGGFGGQTPQTGIQLNPFGSRPNYGWGQSSSSGQNGLFGRIKADCRPKVRRSGYRDKNSLQSTLNDPDPNGDAVLVVSPPEHFRKYKRKSLPTQTASDTATGSIPAPGQTTEDSNTGNDDRKSRFRVSSKHLALASVYFEKMFTPQWREGQGLSTNGSMELKMPDTDPDALLIILNIIHLRRRSVPSSMSLELLTELAVLTDYFQCHEALEPHPAIRANNIKSNIPVTYCDELVKWTCISWVFNFPDIFSNVTKTAQLLIYLNLIA